MKASAGKRVLMLLENQGYPQDPRVSQEARALTEAGYRVAVICPTREGQPWREDVDGVAVYRFPRPPEATGVLGYLYEYGYSMVAMFLLSLYVLLRRGFDIVHTHNPPDTLVLIAAFHKLLGKRFIFDHHDLAPEMYRARFGESGSAAVYRVLVAFERLSCRLADHVIATNESYKRVAMERGRVPEHRVTVVRNGPDLEVWRPTEPAPIRRQGDTVLIGYGGVVGIQDGVDYLVRALYHLVYDLERSNVLCMIAGDGDALPGVRALAEQLGIDKQIWFTGWLLEPDLIRHLAAVDICVEPDPSNPYNDRSTMIKVMNYMALGKPIVAFDLPEHRASAGDAAVYVRANDEREFARALADLMDDPGRREAMGAIGRQRVESELAWYCSVPHLLAAYRAVETAPR